MDFVFQGFQSALPLWLYTLLAVAALALAWWSYKDVQIKPALRYFLTAIRGLVLLILLVILINPFFQSETSVLRNPEILVMLDNSESISLKKGNYNGLNSYREVLNTIGLLDPSGVSYRLYSFGKTVEATTLEDLSFDEAETNIYEAVSTIRQQKDEIVGAIIITDGIFTEGRDPSFEITNIGIPIMSIALGDTTRLKDILVSQVNTPGTGYLNTLHPVQVTVNATGFDNGQVPVQIKKDNTVIDRQMISFEPGKSSYTVNFELMPEDEGLNQYEVSILPMEGEWTERNNRLHFAVDVLDEKQTILSLAFEVYPDVAFVRNLLAGDKNTTLISRTWLGGNRFIEGNFNLSTDTVDLLIVHGYPSMGIPEQIKYRLSEMMESVPVLLAATPQADYEAISQLFDGVPLPLSYNSSAPFNEVQPTAVIEPTTHPIMELPQIAISRIPTVYAPIANTKINPGTTTLFSSSYRGSDTGEPLISVIETGNRRIGALSGFGWYRVAQSPDSRIREYVRQLFQNLVSWTASKPDNRRLKIVPLKKVFSTNETVRFNASLTNERGDKESQASIELIIAGEDIESRIYSMDNTGNGEYKLEINALPPGLYEFNATAQKGNRTIDTQSGEISISRTNSEFTNIRRNSSLLQSISAKTGGNAFLFDQTEGFRDSLNAKGMLDKKEEISTNLFFPYQHSFWFLTVILLLTAEWITRKYVSLA